MTTEHQQRVSAGMFAYWRRRKAKEAMKPITLKGGYRTIIKDGRVLVEKISGVGLTFRQRLAKKKKDKTPRFRKGKR